MKFILASSSKRRIEYLKGFGFEFEIKKVDFEEFAFETDPLRTAVENAYLKAFKVANEFRDLPVFGLDTVVEVNGKIFGKPKNKRDNLKMLKALVGKTHRVITGVVCIYANFSIIDYDITYVKFRDSVDKEILNQYVESGEGLDKAGGYAVQGLGAVFVDGVVGSLDNVIGIPIIKVYQMLKMIGEV